MKISGTPKQASAGQVGPRNAALRPTRRLDPRRIPKYIVAAFFLAAGFYFAATTLCAIINFAWRQPMFDQYRSYATFLSLPFPQNILQSDNGHHPVIPNLFRLAEIHWFAANQLLQISVGTCCAFLSAMIISVSVWRTRNLPLVARAAGVMLAVLGLLWLANARMLLHGNESLDVYLLVLAVVCAALCTHEAARRQSMRWLGVACAACAVATFCFGPGIASFAAVIALCLLLRLPLRWLLLPLGTLAACLTLYLFVLPGDQGVRGMLELHPLESAKVAAQWLSAPWINGWLGAADPAANWVPVDQGTWNGAALVASANAVVEASGTDWRTLGVVIGVVGAVAFLARTLRMFFRTPSPATLETLTTGIAFFALASAAIIGIGRLDYFRHNTDQVFADRYLLWPSLFWSSFAMLALLDIVRGRQLVPKLAGLTFLLALPLTLLGTQKTQAGWGSAVYREAQRTAAALRSGVFDKVHFTGNTPDEHDIDLLTVDLLRAHHLAMFADPAWERVGLHWDGQMDSNPPGVVQTEMLDTFTDARNGKPAAHFDGWVTRGIAALQRTGQLAILDEQNTLVGVAEYSFIAIDADALRLAIPRKRGFDGYISNYDPVKKYTLVLMSQDGARASVLSVLSGAGSGKSP
jgi:hypothetical protein